MRDHFTLPVMESSQIGAARRNVTALAHSAGFEETAVGKLAIVITECAANIVKHASGGELVVRLRWCGETPGIEILALDKGPGIPNPQDALRDGYSTTGTSGTGLGAIVRLSDSFDIYSVPQLGTAILARLWARPTLGSEQSLEIGVVNLPYPGEDVSGDAWAVYQRRNRAMVLLADGLGHGLGAYEAALAATKTFARNPHQSPHSLVTTIHTSLKHTRGAVIGIAAVDLEAQSVSFAGIGNIVSSIYTLERVFSMTSHNGTVGHDLNRLQEFTYPFPEGSVLVMSSDGCSTRLSLHPYRGLIRKDPALIAGVLYRDFRRGNDDVTVLVAKKNSESNDLFS